MFLTQKVLFTASTYSHIEHFHLPYLRAFQERGWEVHIACAGVPASVPFVDRALDVPFRKQMRAPENFKAAGLLRRLEKEERYDLITMHTSLAAFFTRLALKNMRDRPQTVNMVHGYLFDDATPSAKRKLLLEAERFTARQTDLLLTMNRWDNVLAQNYHLGGQVENVPGIGVDFSRLDGATPEDGVSLRREYGIPDDAFVLIYAAEFSLRKSQSVLIRAMQQLRGNVILVLPGDGSLLEECRTLAARLESAGRVIFPGRVGDMAPWYRIADAAVSASRSEGLPFNIMEAMYAGLPVAASAVKGHTDLIEDGERGLLYPYGDADACAEQIRRLMDSPELRERLAENAKRAVGRYDLKRVLPEVMEQYLSVLDRKEPVAGRIFRLMG